MGGKSANIDTTDSSALLLLVDQLENTVNMCVSSPHCCI